MVTEMTPPAAGAPPQPTSAPLPQPGAPTSWPPYVAPEPTPARRGPSWLIVALFAVFALLIGAGIGYAASIPQQRTLEDEKAAVETARSQLQTDVDNARKDLESTRKELAGIKEDLSGARADVESESAAKDVCETAATDASDLIAEWENFMGDLQEFMAAPAGSAAEAELRTHMTSQLDRMAEQSILVEDELSACRQAVS